MLSMEFNLQDAQRAWKKDGIIKGKEIKAEEIAERMLKRGLPILFIAEDTGLSIRRVEEIALKLKNE